MRAPALAQELRARLLILALCALLPGCVHLAPWERGILAKPHMAPAPAPLRQALDEHVNTSREASAGGSSTARGGGCGCN
jgi:hypothetical protein